jgi:hypothetical protein
MKPKLLFLFPECWDHPALAKLDFLRDGFQVITEGFDLFRFPENANLLWFDAPAFVERMVRRYRGAGLAGVVSTHEQYGALIAAIVAQRLGLPGTDPSAVIRSQHKLLARQRTAAALPGATPRFTAIPWTVDSISASQLPYPLFVKPVKAAYSVLARRVDHADELLRHLAFRPWERHVIRRLIKPFDDLAREQATGADRCPVDVHHLIGEEVLDGVQVNVDGYVHHGAVHCLGVVDSVMYPGTIAFQRFEYPSRLPAEVQRRLEQVASRAVEALGFDHGMFNVELFWRPRDGDIKIIEINPRLAGQLADLYERVDGGNPYQVLADLALGRAPCWSRGAGRYCTAASFVLREFDDAPKVIPSRAERRWLRDRHPDAALQTFMKRGESRGREMRWLGSYRYATLSLGGRDREDLFRRFEDIRANIAFERPPLPGFAGALAGFRSSR